jgi:hypothetical protein
VKISTGDLVKIKNLRGWRQYGLVVEIRTNGHDMGQLHLFTRDGFSSIPFATRDKYIEVISEGG